ncbi:hypothetical protein MMC09_005294 [Bachmanniomyces sp. S44760]|nr:hypothetical protein [Bachmanniomyces sp. S44760]
MPPTTSPPPLFTLPIPSSSTSTSTSTSTSSNSGTFTLTSPQPQIYLLTFTSPPDNRMTPEFCTTFLLALDILEDLTQTPPTQSETPPQKTHHPKGILITTSSLPKFYSNGLDYPSAISTPKFFTSKLYPLWTRLLTYPLPTLALLNGHAFAAGLMTAMMHDYRIMNPHRGYLCLNELEFGAPLTPPMASIFREKVARHDTYRSLVLEAKRFNALEALEGGLVDGLGGMDEAVAFVGEGGMLVWGGKTGVYGRLKAEMFRETVGFLEEGDEGEERMGGEERRRREGAVRRVRVWEEEEREKGRRGKAKL